MRLSGLRRRALFLAAALLGGFCSGGASAIVCEGVGDGLALKAIARFEASLPPAAGSIGARQPALVQWVRAISMAMPNYEGVVRRQIGERRDVPMAELLQGIVKARNDVAAMLRSRADQLGSDKAAATTLRDSAEHFEFVAGSSSKWEARDWQRYQDALATFGNQIFNEANSDHQSALSDVGNAIAGEWGELKVSMIVSKLRDRSVYIGSMDGAQRLSQQLKDKEIDLIFELSDGSLAWGEVKNLKQVLKPGGPVWAKILKQQLLTRDAIQQLGLRVEQHLFIMSGVSRAAYDQLSQLGLVVHAPVTGAPVAGDAANGAAAGTPGN